MTASAGQQVDDKSKYMNLKNSYNSSFNKKNTVDKNLRGHVDRSKLIRDIKEMVSETHKSKVYFNDKEAKK